MTWSDEERRRFADVGTANRPAPLFPVERLALLDLLAGLSGDRALAAPVLHMVSIIA